MAETDLRDDEFKENCDTVQNDDEYEQQQEDEQVEHDEAPPAKRQKL